jgi:hypothetical protein
MNLTCAVVSHFPLFVINIYSVTLPEADIWASQPEGLEM